MYKRGTSQDSEKQEKIDEIVKGLSLGKKKWVRYNEGALLYSMGIRKEKEAHCLCKSTVCEDGAVALDD